jgi:hypothetical protein
LRKHRRSGVAARGQHRIEQRGQRALVPRSAPQAGVFGLEILTRDSRPSGA